MKHRSVSLPNQTDRSTGHPLWCPKSHLTKRRKSARAFVPTTITPIHSTPPCKVKLQKVELKVRSLSSHWVGLILNFPSFSMASDCWWVGFCWNTTTLILVIVVLFAAVGYDLPFGLALSLHYLLLNFVELFVERDGKETYEQRRRCLSPLSPLGSFLGVGLHQPHRDVFLSELNFHVAFVSHCDFHCTIVRPSRYR